MLKIAEEYGDLVGGVENFLKIYKKATPERYCFFHMSIQDNPVICYKNFEEVIAMGDKILGDIPDISDFTNN